MRNAVAGMIALLLITALSQPASGFTAHRGDRIHITNLHHLDDDLYAFGQYVIVDGEVDGDICAGAYEYALNGRTTGSQNIFAYNCLHTGRTDGSLRSFSYSTTIDGYVGRSVIVSGYSARFTQSSKVKGDVAICTSLGYVEGTIVGNFEFTGNELFLSGLVKGDVRVTAEEIHFTPPTVIKGDFIYSGMANEIDFDTIPGVTISGKREWVAPMTTEDDVPSDVFSSTLLMSCNILAAFLFGLVFVGLFRTYAGEAQYQLRTRFAKTVATGLLSFIILTIALVLIFVSGIAFLVGLIMINGKLAALGSILLILSIPALPISSFAGVSGMLLIYAGQVMIALMIGSALVGLLKKNPTPLGKGQMFLGLLILGPLCFLPYLGPLLFLGAGIVGAGAIILSVRKCHHEVSVDHPDGSPDQSSVTGER